MRLTPHFRQRTVDHDAWRRYTSGMQVRLAFRILVSVVWLAMVLGASKVRAADVSPEIWIGGGVSNPDYRDDAEACARGGVGVVLARHLTLGVSGQADNDHFHYFTDAGVILPGVGLFLPYGRYQFGRREDSNDNAWGWCAGIRLAGEGVSLYVEFNDIVEPESNRGVTLGIWF